MDYKGNHIQLDVVFNFNDSEEISKKLKGLWYNRDILPGHFKLK